MRMRPTTRAMARHSGTATHGPATAALAAAALLATGAAVAAESEKGSMEPIREVHSSQEPGKVTYWVLPGPRKLEKTVFGTPDNPKTTLKPKIEAVKQSGLPPAVKETVINTIKKVPPLVAVPNKARSTGADGSYVFNHPNPFSNKARIVDGQFEATFTDVVTEDPPGPPPKTPDTAQFEASFTDPAGNEYRVVLDHVVKPPLPGYKTQGGVMTETFHHGTTGTGTPLMPRVYTFGAFWGLGEIYINGEKVDDHRVMHVMTTEVVRNRDYELVFSDDLPLGPGQRHISDQEHHTHLMMPPVRGVPGKGPVFDPLPTAFELPNGKKQPFLHIMFEQDTLRGASS